jgi:hypothetical protein
VPPTVISRKFVALLGPGNAGPSVAVPEDWRGREANGGTGVARPVEPGIATNETLASGVWASWDVHSECDVVFPAVPVRAPLPDIAVHFTINHRVSVTPKMLY